MTTETLTGRELDAAVAKVLGWRWVMPQTTPGRAYLHPPEKVADWLPTFVSEVPPEGKQLCDNAMPAYSAPDCSGVAPVLAWLEKETPDGLNLEFVNDGYGWRAGYWHPHELKWVYVVDTESTLPTAACRLLVAWAAKRG
jgi:hypothetical protein